MYNKSYLHISPFRKEFYRSDNEKSDVKFSTTRSFLTASMKASGEIDYQEFDDERQGLIDHGFIEVSDPGKISVLLTYFKPSGKYYADGVLQVDRPDKQDPNGEAASWYEAMELIRAKLEAGDLPGLAQGTTEFDVHVSGRTHPGGYPHIFKKR